MLAKIRRKGKQPSMNKISLHYTRHEYNVVIRFEKWRTQLLISTLQIKIQCCYHHCAELMSFYISYP